MNQIYSKKIQQNNNEVENDEEERDDEEENADEDKWKRWGQRQKIESCQKQWKK